MASTSNSLARRRGKDFERRVAKRLGGKRSGATGQASPDVVNDLFSYEAKSLATGLATVRAALDQAVRNAVPGTIGVAVLHLRGLDDGQSIVALRLADWEALHVAGEESGDAGD